VAVGVFVSELGGVVVAGIASEIGSIVVCVFVLEIEGVTVDVFDLLVLIGAVVVFVSEAECDMGVVRLVLCCIMVALNSIRRLPRWLPPGWFAGSVVLQRCGANPAPQKVSRVASTRYLSPVFMRYSVNTAQLVALDSKTDFITSSLI